MCPVGAAVVRTLVLSWRLHLRDVLGAALVMQVPQSSCTRVLFPSCLGSRAVTSSPCVM